MSSLLKLAPNIKGIRGALEVYGKLLDIGLEVYVPVMYIRHDCVVKTRKGTHVDIEIKTRYAPQGRTGFHLGTNFKGRPDFFVVVHFEGTDDFWVLPSGIVEKHYRKDRLLFSLKLKTDLNDYHNDFKRIADA